MKNLQFKLDMIGAAIGCIGILSAAYAFYTATLWLLFGGVLLAVICSIMVSLSDGIAKFIRRKDNGDESSSD